MSGHSPLASEQVTAIFLVALQNAAYNAPPFPAGRKFRPGFQDSAMPRVADHRHGAGGIFIARFQSLPALS
jgi:hypothetical protein